MMNELKSLKANNMAYSFAPPPPKKYLAHSRYEINVGILDVK